MPLLSPELSDKIKTKIIGNPGRLTLNLVKDSALRVTLLTAAGLYGLFDTIKAPERESIVPVVTSLVEVPTIPEKSAIPSVEPYDIAPTFLPSQEIYPINGYGEELSQPNEPLTIITPALRDTQHIDSLVAPEEQIIVVPSEDSADRFLKKVLELDTRLIREEGSSELFPRP